MQIKKLNIEYLTRYKLISTENNLTSGCRKQPKKQVQKTSAENKYRKQIQKISTKKQLKN